MRVGIPVFIPLLGKMHFNVLKSGESGCYPVYYFITE